MKKPPENKLISTSISTRKHQITTKERQLEKKQE